TKPCPRSSCCAYTSEIPSSATKKYRKFAVYVANTTKATARIQVRTADGLAADSWSAAGVGEVAHESATGFISESHRDVKTSGGGPVLCQMDSIATPGCCRSTGAS